MLYEVITNGFSVSVAPAELGKLQRLPGVKAIYPVVDLTRITSYNVCYTKLLRMAFLCSAYSTESFVLMISSAASLS